jgi:hypothetical protein
MRRSWLWRTLILLILLVGGGLAPFWLWALEPPIPLDHSLTRITSYPILRFGDLFENVEVE